MASRRKVLKCFPSLLQLPVHYGNTFGDDISDAMQEVFTETHCKYALQDWRPSLKRNISILKFEIIIGKIRKSLYNVFSDIIVRYLLSKSL